MLESVAKMYGEHTRSRVVERVPSPSHPPFPQAGDSGGAAEVHTRGRVCSQNSSSIDFRYPLKSSSISAIVPCYKLGALHQTIKHDLAPCPHGLMETWKEILEIQRRQTIDPSYEYAAPIPART